MNKPQTVYQMLLVKPYQRDGEKKYSYTNIGIAFRKFESDVIDMKLDLFPILIPGAFIQLKPVVKTAENNTEKVDEKKDRKKAKKEVK
jgi:hypothetical protein